MAKRSPTDRCPICGEGTWIDVAFDANGGPEDLKQDAGSRQVEAYTCGHEVTGPKLAAADADEMVVETRESQDTVERGR